VDSIAVEKQGMGIVKVTHPPQASPQEIAKVEEIAKNVRANEKAFIKLPAGYNLEFIDTHANTLKETKEMIDHHDRQISKAFLAQFLELGAQKGGSYALSADQSKLFLLGLEYITKIIQEEMNKAIKELVDLNFPNLAEDEYPTLEYGAIGDVDYVQLSEALTRLSQGGIVTPTADMEKYVLNTMKVPVADDLDEIWEEKAEQAAQLLAAPIDEENKPLGDTKAKPPNKSMKPKAEKKEDIKATEFMEDIMEFHEQLERAIAAKEANARTV
jgi:phage gp29-like protein